MANEDDNRESIDPEKREMVLARDQYSCQFCGFVSQRRYPEGAPPHQDDPVELEVHHIIPESVGGTDQMDNLITMCRDDHGKLHHDPSPNDELSSESVSEIVDLAPSISDADSTEVDVLIYVIENGPVRTGQVAEAVDISAEHSRRLLYRLGAQDLVVPTGDGGWDLSDRVSDPPIGTLPDDPKLAAARVRDEMLLRVAKVTGVDDSVLAEIADVSPRTARVSIDRAATYQVPLPDTGPRSDDDKSIAASDDESDNSWGGLLRYAGNGE